MGSPAPSHYDVPSPNCTTINLPFRAASLRRTTTAQQPTEEESSSSMVLCWPIWVFFIGSLYCYPLQLVHKRFLCLLSMYRRQRLAAAAGGGDGGSNRKWNMRTRGCCQQAYFLCQYFQQQWKTLNWSGEAISLQVCYISPTPTMMKTIVVRAKFQPTEGVQNTLQSHGKKCGGGGDCWDENLI